MTLCTTAQPGMSQFLVQLARLARRLPAVVGIHPQMIRRWHLVRLLLLHLSREDQAGRLLTKVLIEGLLSI